MNQNDFDPVLKLSPRELEVFTLAGHGKTTKEISRVLGLSMKTIESHNAHIREKTGLNNVWAVRHLATRFVVFCEQNKVKLAVAEVHVPRLKFQPA